MIIWHRFLTANFVCKYAFPTFTSFVFRMSEAYIFEYCIQIFFPQPCTIIKDAINLVAVIVTIFYFFMSKYLQAETLQVAVLIKVWVPHRAKVAIYDM